MNEGVMNTSTSSDSSSADSPHTHFYKYRSMSNAETDEESSALSEEVRIKVGICAMNKKTYARPMKEILKRLKQFVYLEFLVFPDEMILNEPVENWPVVDCLISFYSKGFPLAKAISYAKMRKPLVINDLEMQFQLQDRRETYRILTEEGLEIPRHAVFTRDEDGNPVSSDKDIEEFDDTIIVNGKTFHKPFVEKPVSAEDHNIYIYYPTKAGGGCQILFRKIGCRSSVYSSESNIRRTGSYIYEDFMPTDGTDVKVYTVGEEYAHAEARKSPVLDGKVERDSGGKELRYPVILSGHEKLIAKRVCKIFKQTVCGFDLLRANGKSLVCDVNGFSFVKTSQKYYDDCSQLLADMILQNLAPQLWVPQQVFPKRPSIVSPTMSHCGNTMELRCVIALIRHGDRTPKQKMKMVVTHQLFVDFYEKCGGPKDGQLKIKNPKELQELLDITRILLDENDADKPIHENKSKLSQMKNVLEMYGHFSGINRKVQLKAINDKRNYELRMKFKGRNKKSQTCVANSKALLLILKWGGELTPMGKTQAEDLGRAFRCVYPGGQGEYGRVPGFGFLRLHSTYRHDLKMYASDEGRVQMTAAAFAKGLLALEGELTPILVSLVKSDKHVTDMLDTPPDLDETMLGVKSRLHDHLHSTKDFTPSDEAQLAPYGSTSVLRAMREVKNPYELCQKVYLLIKELVQQINEKCDDPANDPSKSNLYHDESLSLMKHRWEKLEKDFKNDDDFDISLIPDIYDCVKYDFLHNRKLDLMNLPELHTYSKYLADIVIPLEYGITTEEKLKISKSVCNHFFRKIQADLQYNVHQLEETVHRLDPSESHDVASPHRHVRTRLYFTSESHVHSVISALKHGHLFKDGGDSQWDSALEYIDEVSELNYLTQIVLMQYENPTADPLSDDRFHIELFFSPGIINPAEGAADDISEPSSDVTPTESTETVAEESSAHRVRTTSEGDIRLGRSKSAIRSQTSPHSPTHSLSPSLGNDEIPVVLAPDDIPVHKDIEHKAIPGHHDITDVPVPIDVKRDETMPEKEEREYKAGNGSHPDRKFHKPHHDAGRRKSAVEANVNSLKGNSAPNPVWLSLQPLVARVNATSHLLTKKEPPKKITDTVCIRGVDIIETSPSCHPLICLHSNIKQKQMESFLQEITSSEESMPVFEHSSISSADGMTETRNDMSESRNDSMLLFPL